MLRDSLVDHAKDLSAENEVRYKLIIESSGDESLVRLLFSFGVLDRDSTRIHVCTTFLGDADTEKVPYHTSCVLAYLSIVVIPLAWRSSCHKTFSITRSHCPAQPD